MPSWAVPHHYLDRFHADRSFHERASHLRPCAAGHNGDWQRGHVGNCPAKIQLVHELCAILEFGGSFEADQVFITAARRMDGNDKDAAGVLGD